MRYLSLLFLSLLLTACNSKQSALDKRLQDTLAKLRIRSDFKPLPEKEVYAFLNKYFFQHLDEIHRQIFIHPLNDPDFKEIFKKDSVSLVSKYAADSSKASKVFLAPPPPFNLSVNDKLTWDQSKLNCIIIKNDSLIIALNKPGTSSTTDYKLFRKKYGLGYVIISYPLYNPHTKMLIIREYFEDAGWCGTGKDRKFRYLKTSNGWQAII